jgi:hypothetical protein
MNAIAQRDFVPGLGGSTLAFTPVSPRHLAPEA